MSRRKLVRSIYDYAQSVIELTFDDTIPTAFQIQPPEPRHPSGITPSSEIRLLDQARIPYPTRFGRIRHLGLGRISRAWMRMKMEDQAKSLGSVGQCRIDRLVDKLRQMEKVKRPVPEEQGTRRQLRARAASNFHRV